MRRLCTPFLVCSLLTSSVLAQGLASAQSPILNQTIVTAAQVNGTWKSPTGSFKVWALGNQKLRVEFDGFYEYDSPMGRMANVGTAYGVATINGDRAMFKPEGAEQRCSISMRFTQGKLFVAQSGQCGFGHNVTASGTYRKVSHQKPKFEQPAL